MAESIIQTKIKKRLTNAGWRVLKVIQLSENGWPDLIALRGGRAVFIEVKDIDREADPLQDFRIQEAVNMGFTAFCTDNPNDERINILVNKC